MKFYKLGRECNRFGNTGDLTFTDLDGNLIGRMRKVPNQPNADKFELVYTLPGETACLVPLFRDKDGYLAGAIRFLEYNGWTQANLMRQTPEVIHMRLESLRVHEDFLEVYIGNGDYFQIMLCPIDDDTEATAGYHLEIYVKGEESSRPYSGLFDADYVCKELFEHGEGNDLIYSHIVSP